MRIHLANTVAAIVDVQERLVPVMHQPDQTVSQIAKLVSGLRILGARTLVTEQYRKGLGATVGPVVDAWTVEADGDVTPAVADWAPIEKMSFSCMGEPSFAAALEAAFADATTTGEDDRVVLIAGIEAHVCVLQTTIDLLDAGYEPVVVWDAVSSRSVADRDLARERIIAEGGRLASVESILFELTQVSGTPTFKAISRLVK